MSAACFYEISHKLPLIFLRRRHKVNVVVDDKKKEKARGGCMYETKSKSLLGRAAALCAAVLLALTTCVQGAYAQEKTVIPLGQAVGIKLFADGVLVVDVSALEGVSGKSPAQKCGIKEGDLLLTFNEQKIGSTEHLQEMLRQNGEKTARLTLQRGQEYKTVDITPACTADGSVRLGAWIRDSMAGIGTMTYYDPESGSFGALGHGITDVDTAQLMSLGSGSIMETSIAAFVKERRRMFNLTQVDLAEKSGVGLRFVRELEQGKETLRIDKINQVLALLSIQISRRIPLLYRCCSRTLPALMTLQVISLLT